MDLQWLSSHIFKDQMGMENIIVGINTHENIMEILVDRL